MTIPVVNTNLSKNTLCNGVSLAIETSGRTGSVALIFDNSIVEYESLSGFQKHSSELIPVIHKLLSKHNLTPNKVKYLLFPKGPGSFTGIRIAVTFAKMFAFTTQAKLVAVDTLESIAGNTLDYASSQDGERVAAILDAKRGLFYIAVFQRANGILERISDNLLITPADFLHRFSCPSSQLSILGEGLLYYQKQFEHPNTAVVNPSLWPANACSVWTIGQNKVAQGLFDDPQTLVPSYIRRPEAEENWERLGR